MLSVTWPEMPPSCCADAPPAQASTAQSAAEVRTPKRNRCLNVRDIDNTSRLKRNESPCFCVQPFRFEGYTVDATPARDCSTGDPPTQEESEPQAPGRRAILPRMPSRAEYKAAALAVVLLAGGLGVAVAQSPPVFRSGVTLVTTDVIVRDGDGQFLPDLTRGDFTIYEDGVPQQLASLVLVHGGRVFNQLLPPPPVPEGIILPGRTVPAGTTTPGRIFVIFIDDLHIRPPDTPLIHRAMDLLPETLIHEGDEFGIISSGKSAIRVQMTTDRNRLRAIDRAVGEAFDPRQLIERATQLSSLGESRWRAHVAFKTAIETVRGLEQIRHRRKAFLYVSAGYNFNPFDDSRVNARIESMQEAGLFRNGDVRLPEFDEPALDQFATTDAFGEVFSDSDLHNELLLLIDEANRANVSFYTIDVRGLTTIPDLDFDLRTTEWNEYIRKQHTSLRTLAELTGGIAVVNRNTFREAFTEIDAETSDYYVLGFYSSNPDETRRTRELRVEVARDGAEVRSRTHYLLPFPDAAPAAPAGAAPVSPTEAPGSVRR